MFRKCRVFTDTSPWFINWVPCQVTNNTLNTLWCQSFFHLNLHCPTRKWSRNIRAGTASYLAYISLRLDHEESPDRSENRLWPVCWFQYLAIYPCYIKSDRINKWALFAVTTGVGEVAHCDLASELNAHLEGNLATEASMVVLDTLELIVQGKQVHVAAFK